MKVTPINGYVVMEVDTDAEKTESGLLLPPSEGGKTEAIAIRGRIVAIASDVGEDDFVADQTKETKLVRRKPKVRVGDRVLIAKWEGYKTQLNGINYLIAKEKDIIGILSE